MSSDFQVAVSPKAPPPYQSMDSGTMLLDYLNSLITHVRHIIGENIGPDSLKNMPVVISLAVRSTMSEQIEQKLLDASSRISSEMKLVDMLVPEPVSCSCFNFYN
jgi:hypothetical protein